MADKNPIPVDVGAPVVAPILEPAYAIKPQPPPDAAPPPRKVAIIVNHGMGQQVPYETLELAAKVLWQKEAQTPGGRRDPIVKRMVRLGVEGKPAELELARAEVQLTGSNGKTLEAHLYEAYWAPLTEGKVKLHQVIWFLLDAGWSGIRNTLDASFRRWMFRTWQVIQVRQLHLIFSFVMAILAVLALVVINAMIVAAGTSHALTSKDSWPPDAQLGVLTRDLFFVLLSAIAIFLGTVVLPVVGRCLKRLGFALRGVIFRAVVKMLWRLVLRVAWLLTFAGIAGIIVMGVLICWHLAFPTKVPAPYAFTGRAAALTVIASAFAISYGTALRDAARLLKTRGWILWKFLAFLAGLFTLAGIAGFVMMGVVVSWHLASWMGAHVSEVYKYRRVVVPLWGAGIGASWLARLVIVQYIGDVAAYVSAHTVNEFWEVRKAIYEKASSIARAVYRARTDIGLDFLYPDVVVVGHSLGSVIAYDVLNGLFIEEGFSANPLDIAARTSLFLTFGSPLDKTAFIFRTQKDVNSEIREADAVAVQPMINSYGTRPRHWHNIWSHSDWISGSLEYYDDWSKETKAEERRVKEHRGSEAIALPADERRVQNHRDPEAIAPLVAHIQYWEDDLFADILYKGATGRELPKAPEPTPKQRRFHWLFVQTGNPVRPTSRLRWFEFLRILPEPPERGRR